MMKLLVAAGLLGFANAVNMKYYDPEPNVEAAFKGWVQELYNQTEMPCVTSTFLDFFYPPGQLRVPQRNATGPDEIIELKHDIVPLDGGVQISHYPNITKVHSDNSTHKVYYDQGILNSAIRNGNCSGTYYKTYFTIKKESDGTVNLTPHAGNLVIYDDFYVVPTMPPSSNPCAS